jgi:mannose-6-phosphate isomerase-like protein (cupin superfamily)
MATPETQPAYRPEDYDASTFSIAPFIWRVIEKPWGKEEHLIDEEADKPFMLKRITINPGAQLSEQSHDVKVESWTALSGPCKVILENENREKVVIDMEPGVTYNCVVGQIHRLAAGSEGPAVILEVSSPETGNTFRLQDDYNRPDETPEQRALEREGM